MTDDEVREENQRLADRIAALESICTVLLGQLVRGDATAKRTIAEELLQSISAFPTGNAGLKGMTDTSTKIANDLMRDFDRGHEETP